MPASSALWSVSVSTDAGSAGPTSRSAIWIGALTVVAVYGATTTTGFMTVSNLKAILTAAAFVGIIAVGLTVIVLSGNLFSLALGQTVAVTAMLFLYTLQFGLALAIVLTLLLGLVIGAVQGFAVGAWGANPIIITIGAAGLMEGLAVWLSHGQSIVPPASATSYQRLAEPLLGVPFPVYVFVALTIVLAVAMRRTRFGRGIYLLGENRTAARAAALPITLLTTAAFALTSVFTAGAGVLIGATSQNASLLLTGSYTYDAIAAALVGGNAVTGGRGSVLRTAAGAIFIATISDMLLLRGYYHRRTDPRPRDHRRGRRRPDEPQGAEPVRRKRISTARIGGASRFVPYAILAVMIVTMALLPVVTEYTVRTANVYDVFQNFSSYGLVALALGLTIIAGEFDLSVSSMYLLGGMVAVLTGGGSPLVGILAALGTAVIVGCVQGGLIAYFRLNSMPVTLGGYLVVLGITYILGHSKSVMYEDYNVGLRLDEADPSGVLDSQPDLTRDLRASSRSSCAISAWAGTFARSAATGEPPGLPACPSSASSSACSSCPRSVRRWPARSSATAWRPRVRRTSDSTCSPSRPLRPCSAESACPGGRGSPVGIAAGVLSLSMLQEILAIMRSPDYVSSLITGGLLVVVTILWAPDLSQWFRTTRVAAAVEERV